ncbi:MAG: M28 family peptidase [Planctomycetota bacterium]|nr:M28 family peptidase [Planctomycetota bacterium]
MNSISRRYRNCASLALGLSFVTAGMASTGDEKIGEARQLAMKSIQAGDLQKLVDFLASDDMNGRSFKSAEAHEASKYIAKQFKEAGLTPLGDDGLWFQNIEIHEAAPNVVGIRKGKGDRFLLITAHFDHLPPKKTGDDRIFNGADDNASGTSAIIEIARAFGELDEMFEASIVFVAFNAEERGLVGSRHFAKHPPLDLKKAIGIINLDMVSRGEENLIFCEGGPSAPGMLPSIKKANKTIGLEIRFDTHPEWMRQSDQWSLLKEGVPALYFGVDDHPDYHKVTDHADKILAKLIERVARLTFIAAVDLVSKTENTNGEH